MEGDINTWQMNDTYELTESWWVYTFFCWQKLLTESRNR